MKIKQVTIENYRAMEQFEMRLHPRLTVLHGENGHGKTSVLNAIAVGLGSISRLLPGVSSIDFRQTDRREHQPHLIELATIDGLVWQRRKQFSKSRVAHDLNDKPVGLRELREAITEIVLADQSGYLPVDLPIVAFYDANRTVPNLPMRRNNSLKIRSRYDALEGSLSGSFGIQNFYDWFYAKQQEEQQHQKNLDNADYQLNDLNVVRNAIKSVIPSVSAPRMIRNSDEFTMSVQHDSGSGAIEIGVGQLSGCDRIMLMLVADLAWRMCIGNPHKEDPLSSEAIVLIDEIDLHMHPAWQQRVLPDLMQTFPNSQFIVSTQSPQVLTTVNPENIRELYQDGNAIVAGGVSGPTYGAPSGDVMAVLMRVSERPPQNEFVIILNQYLQLVYDRKGQSADAVQLRQQLETLSMHDLGLDRADIEMMRQEVMSAYD